jgi:hypothetical protein
MNYDLAREIIGCLRVSGSSRAHAERLSRFGLREWKPTLRWLDEAGLALRLWRRLEEPGIANVLPAKLRAALEGNLHDHQRRIAEMAREFDAINLVLESAGVKYVALKGFALIPSYCPCLSLRTAHDYGYVMHPGELERGCRALEAAHYCLRPGSVGEPLVYFHEARPPRRPVSRDDPYSETFARTIELQFWNPDELKIRLDFQGDFLTQGPSRQLTAEQLGVEESRSSPGSRFWALCGKGELLFQLLQTFRHIQQDWCRLASVLDMAWFVQRRSFATGFWERFLERVRPRAPLREIAGLVFSPSAQYFRASLPDVVAAEITRGMRNANALWIDRYGLESALGNFSRNKLLRREFVGDVSVWQTIERRRLFPRHRPNRAAEAGTRDLRACVAAGWKQSVYVAQRLHHHALGCARYGLERLRWSECSRRTGRRQLRRLSEDGATLSRLLGSMGGRRASA